VVEQSGLGGGERMLHRDFPFIKQILTKADYETKNNVYKFGAANLTKLKKQTTENRIIRGYNANSWADKKAHLPEPFRLTSV